MSVEAVTVKAEPEWESEPCESEDSKWSELYVKTEVKEEVVVGTESLQPADAAFTLSGLNQLEEQDKSANQEIPIKEELKSDTDSEPENSLVTVKSSILYEVEIETDAVIKVEPNDTNDNSIRCKPCDIEFDTIFALIEHTKTEHNNKYFNCLKPNKEKTPKQESLTCHCGYVAINKSHFLRHQMVHDKKKPFKCKHCNYSSTQRSNLVRHESTRHAFPKLCVDCESLTGEHLKKHLSGKLLKCPFCSFTSTCKLSFEIHGRIHKGTEIYSCSQCDYKTKNRLLFDRHEAAHTGEKPYKCNLCSYCSAHPSDLRIHLINRHKVKRSTIKIDCKCSGKSSETA